MLYWYILIALLWVFFYMKNLCFLWSWTKCSLYLMILIHLRNLITIAFYLHQTLSSCNKCTSQDKISLGDRDFNLQNWYHCSKNLITILKQLPVKSKKRNKVYETKLWDFGYQIYICHPLNYSCHENITNYNIVAIKLFFGPKILINV